MITDESIRDMVKAAAAGAAAVWIMDRFDWFAFDHENKKARHQTETVRPKGMDPAHALASKLAALFGRELAPAPPHRHPAGLTVHYLVPMGLAALYDVLKQRMPGISKGSGALYGAGIFLLLDEVINPLLGLAAAPGRYPWQRHARELSAHIIYGLVINALLAMLNDKREKRDFSE